jgi:hypothetical protein
MEKTMVSKGVENSLKVAGLLVAAIGGYTWWCGRNVRVGQSLLGLGTVLETFGFMGAEKPPAPKVDLNRHLREALEEQAKGKKDRSNEETIDLAKQMVQAKCDEQLIADLILKQVGIEGFTDQLKEQHDKDRDAIFFLILSVSKQAADSTGWRDSVRELAKYLFDLPYGLNVFEANPDYKLFSKEEVEQAAIECFIEDSGKEGANDLHLIAAISNQYPDNVWWREEVRSYAEKCPSLPILLLHVKGGDENAYSIFSKEELKESYQQASEFEQMQILARTCLPAADRLPFKYAFPLFQKKQTFNTAIEHFFDQYFFDRVSKYSKWENNRVYIEEMKWMHEHHPYIFQDAANIMKSNLTKRADDVGPLAFISIPWTHQIVVLEHAKSVEHLLETYSDAQVLDLAKTMIESKCKEGTIEKVLIAAASRPKFGQLLWERMSSNDHLIVDVIIDNRWEKLAQELVPQCIPLFPAYVLQRKGVNVARELYTEEQLQVTYKMEPRVVTEWLAEMLAKREEGSPASIEGLRHFIPIGDASQPGDHLKALKRTLTEYANCAFFPSVFHAGEPFDRKDWTLRGQNFKDDIYWLSDKTGYAELLRNLITNHTYTSGEVTPKGAEAARECLKKLEIFAGLQKPDDEKPYWPSQKEVQKREEYRELDLPLMHSFKHDEWSKNDLITIADGVPPLAFALLNDEQKIWVLEAASKDAFESLIKVLRDEQLIELTDKAIDAKCDSTTVLKMIVHSYSLLPAERVYSDGDKIVDLILTKAAEAGDEEEGKVWKRLATVDLPVLYPDFQAKVLSKLMIRGNEGSQPTFEQLYLLLKIEVINSNAHAFARKFLGSFFDEAAPEMRERFVKEMDWLKENKGAFHRSLMQATTENSTRELEATPENALAARTCLEELEKLASGDQFWLRKSELKNFKSFDLSLMYSLRHDAWSQKELEAIADSIPPLAFAQLSSEQQVCVLGAASNEAKSSLLKVLGKEQYKACYESAPQAFATAIANLMVKGLTFEELAKSYWQIDFVTDIAREFANQTLFASFFAQGKAESCWTFMNEMNWLIQNWADESDAALYAVIDGSGIGVIESGPKNAEAAGQILQLLEELAQKNHWPSKERVQKMEDDRVLNLPLMHSFKHDEWTEDDLVAIADKVPLLAYSLLDVDRQAVVFRNADDRAESLLAVLGKEQKKALTANFMVRSNMEDVLELFSNNPLKNGFNVSYEQFAKELDCLLNEDQSAKFAKDLDQQQQALVLRYAPADAITQLSEKLTDEQLVKLTEGMIGHSWDKQKIALLASHLYAREKQTAIVTDWVSKVDPNWLKQQHAQLFDDVMVSWICDSEFEDAKQVGERFAELEKLAEEKHWLGLKATAGNHLLPLIYSLKHHEWSEDDLTGLAETLSPLAFAQQTEEQKLTVLSAAENRVESLLAALTDEESIALAGMALKNKGVEDALQLFGTDRVQAYVQSVEDPSALLGELMTGKDETRATFEQVFSFLFDEEMLGRVVTDFIDRTLLSQPELFVKEVSWLKKNHAKMFEGVILFLIRGLEFKAVKNTPENAKAVGEVAEVLGRLTDEVKHWWAPEGQSPSVLQQIHYLTHAEWAQQDLENMAEVIHPFAFAQLTREQQDWVLGAANGRADELETVLK